MLLPEQPMQSTHGLHLVRVRWPATWACHRAALEWVSQRIS